MELKPLSSLMIRLLGRRQHVAVFVVLSLILYVGSSGFQAYVSFLWSGTGTVAVDGTGESELQDRLASFLERPALDHRDMAHASEFGCPRYTFHRDEYYYHKRWEDTWKDFDAQKVVEARRAMIRYFDDLRNEGLPRVWSPKLLQPPYQTTDVGKVKRGIVFSAGDGKPLQRLHLALHQLRNVLGSTLPIEIWHFPEELNNQKARGSLMDDYGGDIVLRTAPETLGQGRNYYIKNHAWINTEFTEFIWLDSDNIPLMEPALHFESQEYQKSRSVFWSDLYRDHPLNSIWRIVGRPCSDEHFPAETGQVVFDKRGNNGLNLAVLHLANHIMLNAGVFEPMLFGDKDTWRFSFYILGLPYQMAPRMYAPTGGYLNLAEHTDFCGHAMLQYGLTPGSYRGENYSHPPAFMHANLAKLHGDLVLQNAFTHVKRPRLNRVDEPSLVRAPGRYTGMCFEYDQHGPDGEPGTPNSWNDNQAVIVITLEEEFSNTDSDMRGYQGLVDAAPAWLQLQGW